MPSTSASLPPLLIFMPAEGFGGAENYVAGLIDHLDGSRPVTVVSGKIVAAELKQRLPRGAVDFRVMEEMVFDWDLTAEQNADRQEALLDTLDDLLKQGAQPLVNLNWLNVAPGILRGLAAYGVQTTVLLHLCPHKILLTDFEHELLRLSVQTMNWVCVARENRFFLARTLGLPTDGIRVIQNGPAIPMAVPADSLEARQDARAAARSALGLPQDARIVLTVGRHNSQKGFLEACVTMREVVRDFPDVMWVWLGGGGEIEVHRGIIEAIGISHKVLFAETREPQPWYTAADIFYQPSKYEGFSLSLLEGASAALPVVTTAVSGTRELITDESLGFVADPLRPVEQAAMLAEFLQMSPKARFSVAQRLAERARGFTRERMYSRMTALLAETLAAPRAA